MGVTFCFRFVSRPPQTHPPALAWLRGPCDDASQWYSCPTAGGLSGALRRGSRTYDVRLCLAAPFAGLPLSLATAQSLACMALVVPCAMATLMHPAVCGWVARCSVKLINENSNLLGAAHWCKGLAPKAMVVQSALGGVR